MSKIFYDHLLLLEDLWIEVEALPVSQDERRRIVETTEELFHYKVLTLILDYLPKVHHVEFLNRFHAAPYDPGHLKFLQEKIAVNLHLEILVLANNLKKEVKKELRKHRK